MKDIIRVAVVESFNNVLCYLQHLFRDWLPRAFKAFWFLIKKASLCSEQNVFLLRCCYIVSVFLKNLNSKTNLFSSH